MIGNWKRTIILEFVFSGLLSISRYSIWPLFPPPVSSVPSFLMHDLDPPLWWRLSWLQPELQPCLWAFYPVCASDPGKERDGECGRVSRWLVPRWSPVLPLLSAAGLQAAFMGWPIRTVDLHPPLWGLLLCSLHMPAVCQPKGSSDYVRHLEVWGTATPYFTSFRGGKHHVVARGPALSTHVLVARSPAGQ